METGQGDEHREAYLAKLSDVSGVAINTFADLKNALQSRLDFFASQGCSVSDHALEYVMYQPASDDEIEAIFAKRKGGAAVTRQVKLGDAAPLRLQARQQHAAL